MTRTRLVGINHIALEVGDIDAALEFYGRLFEFELRGRGSGMAFLDMGDQFLALSEGREQGPDVNRHFGLVVADKPAVREALRGQDFDASTGRFVRLKDPWGNQVEIVDYRDIQFSKAPFVLRAMGLDALEKSEGARRELAERGFEPEG
jgi:lactoylglutathione lyase